MSMSESEYAEQEYLEKLYEEFGPQWAEEHGLAPPEDAIEEFTAERLQSYYIAHPNLAGPACDSLIYARSLMPSYPKAALVFAVTATELAIKTVLLKPIVFGLVHTEALASFITDLTTKHTGMDRFQTILTEILARFGGVDLKTYTRADSSKTLWQEIGEIQKARNAVVHRGEAVDDATANLAIAVASTILTGIFPQVLQKPQSSFARSGRRMRPQIFAANDRMNQILIEHLDATAWRAKPPGKARTIAAIFTHMHNVRSKWVRLTAPHLKVPPQLNRAHCTPQQARVGLAESAARCAEMLAEALGGCGGRVEKFRRDGWAPPWPIGLEMLCYMLCHEAHHRGQVCMLAHQLGFPLPNGAAYRIWNWEKLWRECGSPGGPGYDS